MKVKIENFWKLQNSPLNRQLTGDGWLHTLGMVPHLDQAIFIVAFATPDNKYLLVYGWPPQELTNNYYACVVYKVFTRYTKQPKKLHGHQN